MPIREPVGQQPILTYFEKTITQRKIPHAQLFSGALGYGLLALALRYAQLLLCAEDDVQNKKLVSELKHPDLHISFPSVSKAKTKALSDHYIDAFRTLVDKNLYANLEDWFAALEVENKQVMIGVDEIQQLLKKIALTSFGGSYKVVIIWAAEKLSTEASNKFLKELEEPPEKTVFLLLTEHPEQILKTISSRCQQLEIPPVSPVEIQKALEQYLNVSESQAINLARRSAGNFNRALKLNEAGEEHPDFFPYFVQWVRTAFLAKKNPGSVTKLLQWADEISSLGREQQKAFIAFTLELFRQSFLINYGAGSITLNNTKFEDFDLKKFAPFVNGDFLDFTQNILEKAHYEVERNGNPKLIFSNLAIQLTKGFYLNN